MFSRKEKKWDFREAFLIFYKLPKRKHNVTLLQVMMKCLISGAYFSFLLALAFIMGLLAESNIKLLIVLTVFAAAFSSAIDAFFDMGVVIDILVKIFILSGIIMISMI